jgi:hypothetical protein
VWVAADLDWRLDESRRLLLFGAPMESGGEPPHCYELCQVVSGAVAFACVSFSFSLKALLFFPFRLFGTFKTSSWL